MVSCYTKHETVQFSQLCLVLLIIYYYVFIAHKSSQVIIVMDEKSVVKARWFAYVHRYKQETHEHSYCDNM